MIENTRDLRKTTKKVGRYYETTKVQGETTRKKRGKRAAEREASKSLMETKCDRNCEVAGGSKTYGGEWGGWNEERIWDATAKSNRAVKITISPLWYAPCTLKRKGPVLVEEIHHRAPRDSSILFSGRASRIDILCRSHAERAVRPRRRRLFSPTANKNTLNERRNESE